MIQITKKEQKHCGRLEKEAFFMITFCAAMETPKQPETPEWMREERYMYCDQATADQYPEKISGIYEKIKKIFA